MATSERIETAPPLVGQKFWIERSGFLICLCAGFGDGRERTCCLSIHKLRKLKSMVDAAIDEWEGNHEQE